MPRFSKSKAMLVRARQQQILTQYAQGKTPDQIALSLKMKVEQVNSDIAQATDRLLSHYTCPPQHTFIRYAVFNLSIIGKLQRAVERFEKDTKTVQYNSVISALRAQSDINDRILEKGLEFGVVERKQASKAVRHPKDIKDMLKREILTLSSLLDEVDLSISFHSARKHLAVKAERQASEAARSYVPIIIKPLVGPHGVIRALPDWKYPKKPYTQRPDGKTVDRPVSALTPSQQEHFLLAQEIRHLTTTIDEQQRPRVLPEELPQHQLPRQPIPQQGTRAAQPTQQQPRAWLMPPSLPPSRMP